MKEGGPAMLIRRAGWEWMARMEKCGWCNGIETGTRDRIWSRGRREKRKGGETRAVNSGENARKNPGGRKGTKA